MPILSLSDGPTMLAFGLPGGSEWIVLLVLGLLIFGRRLPEVGRSIGRSIVEFKKGIKGIEDEIEDASSASRTLDEQEPSPRLSERARQPEEIEEARVGGEAANPYAPGEKSD